MFRKPREPTEITPSVGRPPSPLGISTRSPVAAPVAQPKPMVAIKTSRAKPAQKQISSFFGKVTAAQAQAQRKGRNPNESILKFFQKVDAPAHFEKDLFVGGAIHENAEDLDEELQGLDNDENRYNENIGSVKRQRTDDIDATGLPAALPTETIPEAQPEAQVEATSDHNSTSSARVHNETAPEVCNPFAEAESDEEEQSDTIVGRHDEERALSPSNAVLEEAITAQIKIEETEEAAETTLEAPPVPPPLLRKDTSWIMSEDMDEFGDFDAEEFYENGEEYIERKYMEEQAALEQEFEDDDAESPLKQEPTDTTISLNKGASCPICTADLDGFSDQDVSKHVNACLDGNPIALPVKTENEHKSILTTAKRFQRSAIPRPGQANPYSLAPANTGSSAFSKLMSSHAEDEAWAIAAANEMAARGKPAFKRTCPFYKIMPGFFTCVDAFRYGAVEGCNAYFLSHFHSDHYIGLTSTWCHGPIYCSKVTGNLVRQQLKVDPKYVIDLEWEKKTEVPKTEGLFVTMISANHCPGSSLFLFEKIVTKGAGNSKLQRVLHCGDFRACPAHVQHPLLRPDVIDAVTGNSRQQKLDVCYLDTTYLTPKYAFPSQESVIKACADMCVSLSKDQVDEMDTWERTKKARAGTGMVKFVQKEASESTNGESGTKGRGRLLVVIGTYSIGKERICVGIARALKSKIFAPLSKRRICLALEDPELAALLTDDPYEAQIHMQMLMEIRPETLADYLTGYKPQFSRVVGFRPTGWSYRPPNSRFVESPLVQTVLHSDNWKTSFTMTELMPQRGSTRESNCFGVPYSEHSSFRELTMFCCALRIDKIIPTVNIGSAKSREKMKGWIEKWNNDKKKNGLFKVNDDATAW